MGDKFTEGYLMSLIDDAERIILSDPLGDKVPYLSYTLKETEKKREESPFSVLYKEVASCHACNGYEKRGVFAEPVIKKNPKVLFIAPYPEGSIIFSPQSMEKFRAWWKLSLLLEEGEWALTTLIKCPVSSFSKEVADSCRNTLRTEMSLIAPEAMVLLGYDTASYMLRKNLPMDEMRGRKFVVNHIPVFVTYSPSDYINNPSLQRPIWNDMLFIRKSIGTEGRKA